MYIFLKIGVGRMNGVTYSSLLRFFIPLSFSATLVTLSHVIINGTLARGEDAEMTIASYSVAFSFFIILERCVVIFRQTASALVRDQVSYRAMAKVSTYILIAFFVVSTASLLRTWENGFFPLALESNKTS